MTDPHPSSAELAYLGVSEILERLGSGALSSVQLVRTLLERIESLDAPHSPVALRAMAALSSDALAVAGERDAERAAGRLRGPLHGVPVVIKDNIEASGLPGAAGSTGLLGRPAREAPLVARLRRAGAIILGSTNLSQWANIRSVRSTSGWSATGGLVGNPWALDRSAGGSSSGSGAALAAGLAPLAVGTETDGSITCPASVCGVVGLKPTVGLVPTQHVVPIAASQDSPGPMGRRVEDVARLYQVLSDTVAPPARPVRFAWARTWQTEHPATDALVVQIVAALREAGHDVAEREVALPGQGEGADELAVLLGELHDDLTAYLADRPGDGFSSLGEVVAYEDAHASIEQPHFGHDLFLGALGTGGRAGEAYAAARERNLQWAVTTCLSPALEDVDVLIAPAYGPSWKSDLAVGGHPGPVSPATMPAAIAGWPIMSVPIGLVHDMPVGLAILARAQDEWTLLEAGRIVEAVVDARGGLPRPFWASPTRG